MTRQDLKSSIPIGGSIPCLATSQGNVLDDCITGSKVYLAAVRISFTVEAEILDICGRVANRTKINVTVSIHFISGNGTRYKGIVLATNMVVRKEQHPTTIISNLITVGSEAVGWVSIRADVVKTTSWGLA